MALHENFREYTEKEINAIKRDVCTKHQCPYLGSVTNYKSNVTINARCCNYMLYTGKMRDCMPDECTHYKDKNVKHKKVSD